jgi:hypothetical protein
MNGKIVNKLTVKMERETALIIHGRFVTQPDVHKYGYNKVSE